MLREKVGHFGGENSATVPVGGNFSQFDYANCASTEELPYVIDSSRFGLIPDGRDCFFNISLGVLFWHVRHCCVHFFEKLNQATAGGTPIVFRRKICWFFPICIAVLLSHEMLTVIEGQVGENRYSSN